MAVSRGRQTPIWEVKNVCLDGQHVCYHSVRLLKTSLKFNCLYFLPFCPQDYSQVFSFFIETDRQKMFIRHSTGTV